MSANRHLGRIITLQTLYEVSFRRECEDVSVDVDEVLQRNVSRYKAALDDKPFIKKLVSGISKDADKLDELLQPIAPDWPLSQIAKIDHVVLHIGAYELLNHKDVPPKVVINESIELAKAFGGENSSKFINGVLGTFLGQIDPSSKPSKTTTEKAKPDKKK